MMRIAIVNDMPLAVAILRRVVESVADYRVAWVAFDGQDAVRQASADRPDVILMDLVMPVMDGAEATRRIMAKAACPILIVTSSVRTNHTKVYEALSAGGLDAVTTPSLGPNGSLAGAEPLLARLAKFASLRKMDGTTGMSHMVPGVGDTASRGNPMLILGASTGGPDAVARTLAALGGPPPGPIVVVQHIGAAFATGFAEWLGGRIGLPAQAIRTGDRLEVGRVYVAASDDHLVVTNRRALHYTPDPKTYPYRPSVDVFFQSARLNWPDGGVAVLLTGMGGDGAGGLLSLRQAGWHTIAQDQATSVVYGMPKAAAELGAAVEILGLPAIPAAIRAKWKAKAV
jgi:two-component system response regulator WspF